MLLKGYSAHRPTRHSPSPHRHVMSNDIDIDDIRRATIEYYDRRPVLRDDWENEPAGRFPDPAPERAALNQALQAAVRNRRVLEVACGTGLATRTAAEVADSILATDSSETCIRLAKQETSLSNVEFTVSDALELENIPDGFDAAFASGFFHLLATKQRDSFLNRLHSKLRPGSPVFFSASHTRTLRAKKRRFQPVGSLDVFCSRTLSDGSTYQMINNEFDEAALHECFGKRTNELQVHVGDAWWWVTYIS